MVKGNVNPERDIEEVFAELRKDRELARKLDSYTPLSSLVLEVIEERVSQNLTQEDLARRLGTKQSAVSRFENLGRKPGFDFLERLARALGGKLFVTIHGRYVALVPRKYRGFVDELAREQKVEPEKVVKELLVEAIEQKIRYAEDATSARIVMVSPRVDTPHEIEARMREEWQKVLAS